MDLVQASPVTTAEQLLALDEPGFRHELVRGELRRMTGAGFRHSATAAEIAFVLRRHADRSLGRVTGADGGYLLARNPDTVRIPDAAFVAASRLATLPTRGHFEGAPDLAVEVISPNDRYGEVHDKALDWIAAGTRLVWIVDPIRCSVAIYVPDGTIRVVNGDDVLDGGDVLPGFTARVRELIPD